MNEKRLLTILEELKDYEEASDALMELRYSNPLAAENYCRQTLLRGAGDVYYRATVLDTLYSLNRKSAIDLVLENPDRMPDYVLGAALSNVIADESIVPDFAYLQEFVFRMLRYIGDKSFPLELQGIFSKFNATFNSSKAMITLKDVLLTGNRRSTRGLSPESIRDILGEPEIFTKAYRSYPTMLVYGDAEFRFLNDVLRIITITFGTNGAQVPVQIDLEPFPSLKERSFAVVEELLKQHRVGWEKDNIMSDEDQEVYITEHDIHLAFYEGVLVKVGIVYR